MVPRYFERAAEFPKTPTGRIQKFELCKFGNDANAWDAGANGFTVTCNGLAEKASA